MRQKRKEVTAFVPARKREHRLVSVRRVQLQKSAGRVLASNKLARSTPKRVAVRVNGGLARCEVRAIGRESVSSSSSSSCESISGVSGSAPPFAVIWWRTGQDSG
jgi:hypothetical protein